MQHLRGLMCYGNFARESLKWEPELPGRFIRIVSIFNASTFGKNSTYDCRMAHAFIRRNLCLRLASLALIAASLMPASAASAREKITWAIYDLPPSYIVHGTPSPGTLGDGISDRMLD